MKLLGSEKIQMENFSQSKKHFWKGKCLKLYDSIGEKQIWQFFIYLIDDIRVYIIKVILELWKFLPDKLKYQIFGEMLIEIMNFFDVNIKLSNIEVF